MCVCACVCMCVCVSVCDLLPNAITSDVRHNQIVSLAKNPGNLSRRIYIHGGRKKTGALSRRLNLDGIKGRNMSDGFDWNEASKKPKEN